MTSCGGAPPPWPLWVQPLSSISSKVLMRREICALRLLPSPPAEIVTMLYSWSDVALLSKKLKMLGWLTWRNFSASASTCSSSSIYVMVRFENCSSVWVFLCYSKVAPAEDCWSSWKRKFYRLIAPIAWLCELLGKSSAVVKTEQLAPPRIASFYSVTTRVQAA